MVDYKKIIKSRDIRLKILRLLSFVPDNPMLRIQYFVKTGRILHLKHPKRYTEKLQWYKLYYHNPLMVRCVDKYDVRSYVKRLGLNCILNECYGVYERAEDVDFNELPNKFVIKDTLGGGGNSVIICKDKSSFDISECRKKMNKWVHEKKVKSGGREWPYYCGKQNRIIVEKFIDCNDLIDYKMFCFNGKYVFMEVLADRTLGVTVKEAIYNRSFKKLNVVELCEEFLERDIPKPKNYDKMIEIAERLANPFPMVRVDLYNIHGKIIFGELTFFDASGYTGFSPDSFDYWAGNKFILPQKEVEVYLNRKKG